MRARAGSALALWDAGETNEAIAHGEAMLRLNPMDNQGVRYPVVNWMLTLGRDDEAGQLLRRYKDDAVAEWTWSGALAAFRRHGDLAASRKALARAVAAKSSRPGLSARAQEGSTASARLRRRRPQG
jgi:hypothetical protein